MAKHVAVDHAAQVGLCGEHVLVVTLLRQAVLDLQHPNPHIQQEAVDFLHHRQLVAFWTSLIGVDQEAWQEMAEQALQRTREA